MSCGVPHSIPQACCQPCIHSLQPKHGLHRTREFRRLGQT
jgi:hypothetical protein